MKLQDILRMMSEQFGDDMEYKKRASINPDFNIKNFMQEPEPFRGVNTPIDLNKAVQLMGGASPTLSLPAAEGMPNYADGEMPLYTGGLLKNPQGQMVDPQQLLNLVYDMSAPREVRINAIERLRALGIQ